MYKFFYTRIYINYLDVLFNTKLFMKISFLILTVNIISKKTTIFHRDAVEIILSKGININNTNLRVDQAKMTYEGM